MGETFTDGMHKTIHDVVYCFHPIAGCFAVAAVAQDVLDRHPSWPRDCPWLLLLAGSAIARAGAGYLASRLATSGALLTYGPRLAESYRRIAYFAARILKGSKPAELPIEQPTVLELVINLKTAKALGLAIPQSILARADEVIE